ncbi:MAG: START domain-containing protein [Bacteroidota bacterium]
MLKSSRIVVLLLTFVVGFSSNLLGQNFDKTDWKLKTTKGKLKVYTRNNEHSDFKEIRITTTVSSSAEKIISVLNDVAGYHKWVFKCMGAKKIKVISSNDYYYYTKSDFPFPITDRDLVVRSTQWTDEATGFIFSHSKAVPKMKGDEKGFIRIPEFDSYWKLMPQPDGTINIDYVAVTDPGGNLPAWVVNLGITKGPVETMKRFTAIVEQVPDTTNKKVSHSEK